MHRLLSTYVIVACMSLSAQQTAINWTKPECGHGSLINLFDVLDSGKVVVCDYVMLGSCVQCGYASQGIESIVSQFNVQNPGKVVFYSTAYDSAYSCSDMNTWRQNFNLNNTVFKDGTLEFSYYGGFGMPLVVVMGTSSHTVFTVINGYSESDTSSLKNAIVNAIVLSGTSETSADKPIKVFPSPANENVSIQTNNGGTKTCFVYDNQGREVKKIVFSSEQTLVPLADLSDGFYYLKIQYSNAEAYSKFLLAR